YDERGALGDLNANVHVGPARLERLGALKVDLDARLTGRKARVRSFTAAGLGLTLSAHGDTARDAVELDVAMTAVDLGTVARAISAVTRKPPPKLEGSASLNARVHGKPFSPDAEVEL